MTAMRVLEVSTDIGGAYCGWLLASLGAEVTRVATDDATWRSASSPIALGLDYLSQGKRAIAAGRRRRVRIRRRDRGLRRRIGSRHRRHAAGAAGAPSAAGRRRVLDVRPRRPECTFSRGRPGRAGRQRRGVVAGRARPRAAVAAAGRARAPKRRESCCRLPPRAVRARGAWHGPRGGRLARGRACELRRGQRSHLRELRPSLAACGTPCVRLRRCVSVCRPPVQGRRSVPVRAHARRMGAPARRDGPSRVDAGSALSRPAQDGEGVSRRGRPAHHAVARAAHQSGDRGARDALQPGRIADPQFLGGARHAAIRVAQLLEACASAR